MSYHDKRMKYIKDNYTETTEYDFSMSLLCDLMTDDLDDLIKINESYFDNFDRALVEEAFNDYMEMPY